MFSHVPPKERVVYVLLLSVFLFGAGYVGAQRLRKSPEIVIKSGVEKAIDNQFPQSNFVGEVAASSHPGSKLVVDVTGAAKNPGLQKLPPGSRVDDALKAAGGPTDRADLDSVNLAAKLEDGEQVVIPSKGELSTGPSFVQQLNSNSQASSGSKVGKHPPVPIHLGSASYDQLQELPGVGPAMAQKLLAYRTAHGHLSFEDLQAIPGLGPKKLEKLKPWVR